MTAAPASRNASGSPSSGTDRSSKAPNALMPAMLARLYWAATCGDTLRSSTAACALIRSQSIGRAASESATAAAS